MSFKTRLRVWATSSVKPPISQASNASESLNKSYNRSKARADYRQRMRIQFPGGWDNRDSPIFEWYRLQPNFKFQTIEYRKDQEGVQHEYIVLLLQDSNGHQLNSYCRFERTTDPDHRIEAIGINGTTAFDFVQTIVPNHLQPTNQAEYSPNTKLVARITFPCVFDLLDILAICFGISTHPRAMRYTLQQFNCYFFSWTIILCLARRAADWEGTLSDGHLIRDALAQHADDIRAARKFTGWSLMFRMHDISETDALSEVFYKTMNDVSGGMVLDQFKRVICPLLWCNQDLIHLETGLASCLNDAPNHGVDIIMGDSGILDSDKKWDFDVPLLAPMAVVCIADSLFMEKRCSIYRARGRVRAGKQLYSETMKQIPLSSQLRLFWMKVCVETFWTANLLTVPIISILGMCAPLMGVYYQKRASLNKTTKQYLQKLLAVTMTVGSIPKCYWYFNKQAAVNERVLCDWRLAQRILREGLGTACVSMEVQPNPIPPNMQNITGQLAGLMNEAIKIYSESHNEYNFNQLHKIMIQSVRSVCEYRLADSVFGLADSKMASMWKISLRADLVGVVSQTIFANIIRPTNKRGYQYEIDMIYNSENGSELPPTQQHVSHAEIQDIIRERISRLSKKETEHAPIAQYVLLLPLKITSQVCQKEMEDAIQEIWGLCGPLMSASAARARSSCD